MSYGDTIRLVHDELAIRNLIARIAHLADQGEDLDEYVSQFTPDAAWEMPGGPRRGHADILAGATERRAAGTTGPSSNSRHVLTTIAVEVDGTDTATARSYFHFYVNTLESPTLALVGVYDDTFAREGDRWLLARRGITFG